MLTIYLSLQDLNACEGVGNLVDSGSAKTVSELFGSERKVTAPVHLLCYFEINPVCEERLEIA